MAETKDRIAKLVTIDSEIKDLTSQRTRLNSLLSEKEKVRLDIQMELQKLCGTNIRMRHFVYQDKVIVVTIDSVNVYKAE